MTDSFPFYSSEQNGNAPSLYHTHYRCRVAQGIPLEIRTMGTGEGRSECPFCFLLGQFQVNRALRGGALTGLTTDVAASHELTTAEHASFQH